MFFFTSDQHFGHKNIIQYSGRPFSSASEMDAALIERWNAQVGPDDVVYHLGDFTFSGRKLARKCFRRLNGEIKVLGCHWHHDHRWLPQEFGASDYESKAGQPVEILPPMVVLELEELGDGRYPQVIVLCHYPLAEWDRQHHGAWHLHGHSHGTHQGQGAMMDVGVDCTQYQPISLDQVAEVMRSRSDG